MSFPSHNKVSPSTSSSTSNDTELTSINKFNINTIEPLPFEIPTNRRIIRENGLSATATLLNFLKGVAGGPGCLSIALGFKHAGLWAGFVIVFVFGFLNNYCMLMLVHCARHLSKKKGDIALDYGTVRVVKETFDFELPSIVWMLIIYPFLVMLNQTKNLKIIAIYSGVTHTVMIICLIFVFQELIRSPHTRTTDLPWIGHFEGLMSASGAILYAFEGTAMVLPLENKLKHPDDMIGPVGVLSTGMNLVAVLYAACGFYGYITYTDKVKGSITLNMPDKPIFIALDGMLCLVVYAGHVIQAYVIMEMLWPMFRMHILAKFSVNQRNFSYFEFLFRAFVVFVTMAVAIGVPNLDNIIPLVGVTCGMTIAFIIPPIIDTIIFLPEMLEELKNGNSSKIKWKIVGRMTQNVLLAGLGIFGLVAGLQATIISLINGSDD